MRWRDAFVTRASESSLSLFPLFFFFIFFFHLWSTVEFQIAVLLSSRQVSLYVRDKRKSLIVENEMRKKPPKKETSFFLSQLPNSLSKIIFPKNLESFLKNHHSIYKILSMEL